MKCSFRFNTQPLLRTLNYANWYYSYVHTHASTLFFFLLLVLFILHLQSSQCRILCACHNMWFDFVVLDIMPNMWRHVNDTISVCSIWLCIIFLGIFRWIIQYAQRDPKKKNLENVIFCFKDTGVSLCQKKKKLCKIEYQCYNVKWLTLALGVVVTFDFYAHLALPTFTSSSSLLTIVFSFFIASSSKFNLSSYHRFIKIKLRVSNMYGSCSIHRRHCRTQIFEKWQVLHVFDRFH